MWHYSSSWALSATYIHRVTFHLTLAALLCTACHAVNDSTHRGVAQGGGSRAHRAPSGEGQKQSHMHCPTQVMWVGGNRNDPLAAFMRKVQKVLLLSGSDERSSASTPVDVRAENPGLSSASQQLISLLLRGIHSFSEASGRVFCLCFSSLPDLSPLYYLCSISCLDFSAPSFGLLNAYAFCKTQGKHHCLSEAPLTAPGRADHCLSLGAIGLCTYH